MCYRLLFGNQFVVRRTTKVVFNQYSMRFSTLVRHNSAKYWANGHLSARQPEADGTTLKWFQYKSLNITECLDLDTTVHLWRDLAVLRHFPSNMTELERIYQETWDKMSKCTNLADVHLPEKTCCC